MADAAQKDPGFFANMLQGTVVAKRAKLRVLDPKSGKWFNMKIEEKRPKWYRRCFNWCRWKLRFKKRNHDYVSVIDETNQDTLSYRSLEDLPATDGQLTGHYEEATYEKQPGENEVVVHFTKDTPDSESHSYLSVYSTVEGETSEIPQENIYDDVAESESDGCDDVVPRVPPRKQKAEDVDDVYENIDYAPESKVPSDDEKDSYEIKATDTYEQLTVLPCNPETEIKEQSLPESKVSFDDDEDSYEQAMSAKYLDFVPL